MKLRKIAALICATMLATTTLVGCGTTKTDSSGTNGGTAADAITFKLSLADPASSNYAKGANKIAEEVKAATNGKINIQVYAGGSLGGERDTVELAMSNNLDIATCANSVLTNFIPEMGILDQAYLWSSVEEAHAAVDGKLGDLIKEAAEKKGLHVIGFMESGFRNTFSKKPIKSIDDFKGVTIRTMENKYHQAAFESFGAMPVSMAYNDVFTALQQGTVDAAENATANCLASGFYEVTKNITNTQHAFVYIVLCMSNDAWSKIPADLQQSFLDGVKKGVDAQRQYLADANIQAKTELEQKGVTFYDIDTKALQTAYQAKAKEKGFTFDAKWQAAVDEAIASVKK
jgi:tripartite ATP-independent transporter DctP family solute receptor